MLTTLIDERGFLSSLIMVEKSLSEMPLRIKPKIVPRRRIDIVSYYVDQNKILPLLVIECKQKSFSESALRQLVGYNYYIGAPFLAVCGDKKFILFDAREKVLRKISDNVPSYTDLTKILTTGQEIF